MTLTIVDSHCHLDFPDFDGEHEALIARAEAAGVKRMVTICTQLENLPRVQELAEKALTLQHLNVRWHHIGHLQTNKVKQVVPHADLIHAVDSEKLLL